MGQVGVLQACWVKHRERDLVKALALPLSALGVTRSGFEKEVVARLEAVGDGRGPGNT